MFTGIIEELGTVETVARRTAGSRVVIRCRVVLEDLSPGDSVAVNGVCLTAVEILPGSFSADVSPETLERSNLGDLAPGAPVNLERPLSPSSRLGGHLVQGHVDATGEFLDLEELGDGNWWLTVRIPPDVQRYVVFKGSIAVDGISLTVAALDSDVMAATIVPHTYQNTVLRDRHPQDRVNLECDILAKYVEKLLTARQPSLTMEKLRDLGF